MIVPIGDSPNPRFTPWVNYALIALNVGVFLSFLPEMGTSADSGSPALLAYLEAIMRERGASLEQARQLATSISRYDLVVWEHGYRPVAPSAIDAATAMFLHGGWSHLLGNMLFLWIYGDNVEHHLGRFRYVLFYVLAGLVAALGDGLLRPESAIPSVGASGAISGVLGAYFLWFPRNRVRLFVLLFPFFVNTIEVGARWVLGAYILFNNVMPLLFSGATGGVSYGAHLGGFAAGLGAAWLWSLGAGRPEPEIRDFRRFSPGADDPVMAFAEALSRGWFERAAALYLQLPRSVSEERIDADDKLDLAAGLESEGHDRGALHVLQRVVAEHPSDRAGGEARTAAARLLLRQGLPVEAFQLLRDAVELPIDPETRQEAQALMHAIRADLRVVPSGGWWG